MANRNREDSVLQEIEDSLKVSSYIGEIARAIETGTKVQTGIVPNYSGKASNASMSNESSSLFSIDPSQNDYMFKSAASALGIGGLQSVPQDSTQFVQNKNEHTPPPKPQFKISKNQTKALKKYPSLIEFLGTEKGDKIAKSILAEVNQLLVSKIDENTKLAHKNAHAVETSGQNMKAYFVGEDDGNKWVCCVIASGPFRGDEALYYKRAEDKSYVLRKYEDGWDNVTNEFNVVHEYAKE